MGFYLPLIFLPAFLVVVIGKFIFPHQITKREWLLQAFGVVVTTLICMAFVAAAGMARTADYSVFNGFVTGKESVHVSCEHQYVCGETCHTERYTDSKGKSHSRRVCQPKYCDEHSYDVSWRVYTTLGAWTIRREDRRGLKTPMRWDQTEIEEPVSEIRSVSNYLLLDRNRFNADRLTSQKYAGKLPGYPPVYDYWRYNRVLNDNQVDYDGINIWLNNKLRNDGVKKQLNIILVVTLNPEDYYYALLEYWRGARKNDVILFYGVDDEENIKWAKAMSFADGQNNQIMLKQLQSMTYEQKFSDKLVQEQYQLIVEDFKRVPNKTFAYLKNGWVPPTWVIVTMTILNLIGALLVAYFVIKEDVV